MGLRVIIIAFILLFAVKNGSLFVHARTLALFITTHRDLKRGQELVHAVFHAKRTFDIAMDCRFAGEDHKLLREIIQEQQIVIDNQRGCLAVAHDLSDDFADIHALFDVSVP